MVMVSLILHSCILYDATHCVNGQRWEEAGSERKLVHPANYWFGAVLFLPQET